MPRIHTGPKGGRYYIKNGERVYLRNKKSGRSKSSYRRKRTTNKHRTIKGKGGYWQDFKNWSSSKLKPFERGFDAIGTATGIGGLGKVGKWLGGITGLGDYKVEKNSLMGLVTGGTSAGGVPRVQNFGGRVIVNHREYLQDILASQDFSLIKFDINPGLSKTFPWLCDIARQFEQWRPLGIIFAFETHSGDALTSTDTALGSIIISSDYNASNADYRNQNEMLNTEFTTSTKPSCSVLHPLECAPSFNPQHIFYVRSGDLQPTDNSQLWYDLCKTQIATVGMQSDTSNQGKLYISYEIEFIKPILTQGTSTGRNILAAQYTLSGVATATPLGTSQTQVFDNIGLTITPPSSGVPPSLNFPSNNPNAIFLTQLNYIGSGTAACQLIDPALSGPGIAFFQLFENGSESTVPTAVATTAQLISTTAVAMDPIGIGGGIDFATAGNVFPSGITSAQLLVTRLNPDIVGVSFNEKQEVNKGSTFVMSDYESKLRKFLEERKKDGLSVEAKLQIFDKLQEKENPNEIEIELEQTQQQRFDQLKDIFELKGEYDSKEYYPSMEEIDELLDDPNDYPEYVRYCSDKNGYPPKDKESFEKFVSMFLKHQARQRILNRVKNKVEEPELIEKKSNSKKK